MLHSGNVAMKIERRGGDSNAVLGPKNVKSGRPERGQTRRPRTKSRRCMSWVTDVSGRWPFSGKNDNSFGARGILAEAAVESAPVAPQFMLVQRHPLGQVHAVSLTAWKERGPAVCGFVPRCEWQRLAGRDWEHVDPACLRFRRLCRRQDPTTGPAPI